MFGRLKQRLFGGDGRAGLVDLLVRETAAGRPGGPSGAEIGVWKGDFSATLIERLNPSRLYLIDPWRFEPSATYRDSWYGGAAAKSQEDMDAIYRAVCDRFAGPIREGVVALHRCDSHVAADRIEDDSLDFVYVDGNHRYEFVRRDLECFWPKLRQGGLMTGDDYGVTGWWGDGVTRAVDEWLERPDCERVLIRSRQFAMRKTMWCFVSGDSTTGRRDEWP